MNKANNNQHKYPSSFNEHHLFFWTEEGELSFAITKEEAEEILPTLKEFFQIP